MEKSATLPAGLATLSSLTGSKDKRWAFRARGAAGSVVVTVFGILALFAPLHGTAGSWLSIVLYSLGWLVFAAGATMRFWATLYIGGRKLHTLACEGPYSITRNPLYLGTFLIWLSGAIWLQSATLAAGMFIGMLFYRWFAIPAEELQLAATLGEPYLEYCRKTPRFWPRWSQFHSPETFTFTTRGLWLECQRASRWVWLPIIVQVLNVLRAEGWWPHWITLP